MNKEKKTKLRAILDQLNPFVSDDSIETPVQDETKLAEETPAEPVTEEPAEEEVSELETLQENLLKLAETVSSMAKEIEDVKAQLQTLTGTKEEADKEVADLNAKLSALQKEPAVQPVKMSIQTENLPRHIQYLKGKGYIK